MLSSFPLVSGLLGFWQERGATNTSDKLLSIVQIKATVIGDDTLKGIPIQEIVLGEIVSFNASDVLPGDFLILESRTSA